LIAIEKEAFSLELLEELIPLGRKCWKESTANKGETCAFYGERDFDIEPDVEQYQRLNEAGVLGIITIRNDGEAVGYLGWVLYRSWHHRKIICANVDSIYVEPEFRSYTAVMIELFEKEMVEIGVGIIGWPTHVNGPIYELLKARGYAGDDLIMEKRPCASS
jgi:hypothetical protein